MKKYLTFHFLVILFVVIAVFISGCSAGMSKSDRLSEFKADIMALNSPVEHFKGHINSSLVNYGTVTTTGLHNDTSDLIYTGDSITGDTFRIDFNVESADDWVTGVFYNSGSGGLSGDDWYIYSLSDSSGSPTIP